MFSSHRFTNWLLSILFVTVSGCSTGGLGCDCMSMTPLADLGLDVPTDQTIEGGAQVRVTPAGFTKLTQIVPPIIEDMFSDGMCIPSGGYEVEVIGIELADLDYCHHNQGTCEPGCNVNFSDIHTNFSVPSSDVLRLDASIDVSVDVPIYVDIILVPDISCTITFVGNDIHIVADLGFGIDNTDGELTLSLANIAELDLSGIDLGSPDCGLVDDVLNFVDLILDALSSPIGNWIISMLTPLLDDLVQSFLPDPLGFEHLIDLGAFLGELSPGTHATLETRMVPGGYVSLYGGGMSLGIITGLNADEDLLTRGPDLDNEPAYCVPPFAAPDFSQPSPGLPQVTRSALGGNVFTLPAAGEFMGQPDPAAEIAIGLSNTTLDLAGHHLVTSGALCLGVGTELISMLNLGTIGILVPSLAELGSDDGSDPLLLVTRPQKPVTFTIGVGTEEDPSITLHLEDFEADIYAFLYERYIRGLTLKLGINLGINLEFTTDEYGAPAIMPTLIGLEAENIELTVHNAEFLREDVDTLEAVLPAIFDMIAPLISDGLGVIAMPDFAGFTLTNLQTQKVTTTEDDFLALYATLGASSTAWATLSDRYPRLKAWVDENKVDPGVMPNTTPQAHLLSVSTPAPEEFRRGYNNLAGGKLAEVVVAVDTHDDLGRELEWTWNLNGGMWRPFVTPNSLGEVIIRDHAYGFALQGRHTVELRSRAIGDYRTLATESIVLPVVIDSVGPRIHVKRASLTDGKLLVPVSDLVSAVDAVEVAFGAVADASPSTDWSSEPIDMATAAHLANSDKQLVVWARDEMGNQSSSVVDMSTMVNVHTSSDAGCGCATSGTDRSSLGGLLVIGFMTFLLLGYRRKRAPQGRALGKVLAILPSLVFVLAWSALPACSCGADPGGEACEIDEDCREFCPENTIPICFEGQCVCADDVPLGRIGQYSDLDLSSSGAAWVSAYNSTHGDLMVARWPGIGRVGDEAWEFVDGVPDGPVILPESDVRDGVFASGDDIGQYTDIAVTGDDTVMISYFDKEHASLKFISNAGGVWSSHVVDAGSDNIDPEIGYEIAGQYSSITVRSDDGRPGIAYFAQVSEVTSIRTEVRYAAAQSANPTGPQDWNIWIVDDEVLPPPDEANPDVYPIPGGVGLFINSTRLSDQTPALVYYDRLHGYLKLARFDALAGTFSEPEILDGDNGVDVGWYPSIEADDMDELHVTYVDADNNDLYYLSTIEPEPQLVDDGYRIVGTTADGLPKPEFHFVGDDSSICLTSAGPIIVYQDATTHELLLAQRNASEMWEYEAMAGNEAEFVGGYGFYASAKYDGTSVVMSNWVIDQPANDVWVEIFRKTIVVQ